MPKYYCIRLDLIIVVPVLCLLLGGFIGSFFQNWTYKAAYHQSLYHAEMRYIQGVKDGRRGLEL